MTDRAYVGTELRLFARALRWKAYWGRHVRPYLGGRVLEVGAGLGSNTRGLITPRVRGWVCLEPDPGMAGALRHALRDAPVCTVVHGDLGSLEPGARFDAILYADVLEHIADDAAELRRAVAHMAPGAALIVLAPALAWLYSPFDRAIGHHRRYDRARLAAVAPPGLLEDRVVYLDAAGLLASLANRLWLRQSGPTERQIRVWDRVLVPISARLDPLLGHRMGKTILAVWRLGP